MAKYTDYDETQESAGNGKFLNLKAKGDKITIRLVDKPITYFVHWLDDKPVICEDPATCQTCQILSGFSQEDMKKKENAQLRRRQTYVWPVIDRADGSAKIFKGGVNIFLGIKDFALDSNWGGSEHDATRFDVTITRTEVSPANFYSVVPDPTSLNKEITKEEKAEAAKLAVLIDATTTGAEKEEPSTENPKSPEEFIAGLEEDQKKEVSTEEAEKIFSEEK